MLGDLTAERSHITVNTRLRFYMSSVNKDLIYHLYSIFSPYVKTGPKFIHRKLNNLTNLEHIDLWFSTLKYALFNWVAEDFYVKEGNKNIKIVPEDSINRLTPVYLAFWIMHSCSAPSLSHMLFVPQHPSPYLLWLGQVGMNGTA